MTKAVRLSLLLFRTHCQDKLRIVVLPIAPAVMTFFAVVNRLFVVPGVPFMGLFRATGLEKVSSIGTLTSA